MNFKSITIEGFKSFNEKCEFNLDRKPGLYLLTGKNKVDIDLGANGSGKSTIWDAVTWCLFGKTARGVKADDIISWNSENKTKVVVVIDDHIFIRTKSPNKLTIDDKVVTQQELENKIGINFSMFVNSVIIPQSNPMFFDYPAKDRSDLLSDVLDLDVYYKYSDEAKNKRDELKSRIKTIEDDLFYIEGQLQVVCGLDYSHELNTWEANSEMEHSKLENDLMDTNKELKRKEKQVKEYDEQLEKVRIDLDVISNDVLSVNKTIKVNDEKLYSLLNSISRKGAKIGYLKTRIVYFQNTNECNECGQSIDSIYADDQLNGMQEEYHSLFSKMKKVKNFKLVCNKLGKKLKDKKDKLEEKIKTKREHSSDIDHRKRYSVKMLNNLTKVKIKVKNDMDKLSYEINPWKEKQKEVNKSIKEHKSNIKKYNGKLKRLVKKADMYNFWIEGFKNIRMELIDIALGLFEIETNNNLKYLGLQDWKVSFGMEKINKSGTVKKGFEVNVIGPENTESVRWEVWSGGESQRLRVSGVMGLSNMINDYTGFDSNIEIWDEPSSHLSEQGVDDLLQTLKDRAENLSKCIWIVDHTSFNFGGFINVETVIKNENGSYVN